MIFSARKLSRRWIRVTFAGEVGQEQRLFHGCVAAADDHDLFATIEEPVAGGAGRYAEALEMFLGRQAQPFRLCPGAQDHRIGGIGGAAVGLRREGAVLQVKAR
jgi:hypothetical protein